MSVTGAEYVDKVLFVNPLVMFPLSIGEMREVKETQSSLEKKSSKKVDKISSSHLTSKLRFFPLA